MKSSVQKKTFLKKAEKVAFDKVHREKIKFNISRYDRAVEKGKKIYSDLSLARERAGYIKYKVINDLDKYLIEFEDNFTKNGGKVIWAADAREAIHEILKIARKNKVKKVVKSKSMTTEEVELNKNLQQIHIESLETDLGEFIVQQAGQKPYHIVTPAMHMSKEDIAALYHKKFNTDEKLTPEELTLYTRKLLRKKFVEADMGISGANFLIADIGGIAVTENEGNAMLSMSFPKIHIAIAGIEKLIPRLEDLDLYWPLLATHGTGQNMTVYNSILTGPKKAEEKDGPEEMYVILLDNGRTNILAKERQRQALSCIRCGACLNACPIYKNIGGHTYDTTYSGPIGSVITPYLKGLKDYNHLSFACTICGKCTEVCPVKIPLHELMLVNRDDAVKNGFYTYFDKKSVQVSTKFLLSRKRLDMFGGKMKNFGAGLFMEKVWGPRRELPEFAEKSFSKQWKEKFGEEND
ncbi:iron-sulfur cluster-binding protein [Candidatus Sulfidibacterium hydrothermale]|uniref:LutB/LldF family L-lactate oxidation iron-sulfur protein n=1 Tax=Candidatus Sulfidibacterium hydrothermale TaxID=2875962 RepID=UPI001F0AF85C|nr:LutB/LldF family L-lactate oxidation iron-sulfur protein [Candidatus Sulfidibacterium hydrothermale]UBM62552.1 iron-sulfur cluster-binding protein [Candidatus Sulfidibacterium hydrothermale]